MAQRSNIVDGPSKFDLMLALFDSDSSHRRTVAFLLENPEAKQGDLQCASLNFVINEVGREDGSGENWLFDGYYKVADRSGNARGFFSTRTRKGWVQF